MQVGDTPVGPPWFVGAGQQAVDQFRMARQNATPEVSGRRQNRADSLMTALEDTAPPAGLLVPDQSKPAGRDARGGAGEDDRCFAWVEPTAQPRGLVVRRCTVLVTLDRPRDLVSREDGALVLSPSFLGFRPNYDTEGLAGQ